ALRSYSIADVLELTVNEACELFADQPAILRGLEPLRAVGLGYIRLGQSATTLSGGEAQRVKLSLELSKRDTGRTLYILDEPTTGLHFHDIDLLLRVLHQLRDAGNTVVVIEHNLDVIKTADWVIDLGPEGGDAGGRIVAAGAPEEVAANPASYTGRYLAAVLARGRERKAA
ncbi:MAG: excinuclease ABC subunit UvrA, partial [Burkholderiaceae bacterium]|nr:excinuclease ABC subunit UvrA [Burkholderiaceae bacterium]